MRRRCPRCGARLSVEDERWSSRDRTMTRVLRCSSCGGRYETIAEWRPGAGPSSRSDSARSGCLTAALWVVVSLVVAWGLLRGTGYGERVGLYRAVTGLAQAFLSPVTVVALAACAVLLYAVVRVRGRRARPDLVPASVAPDVHIRAEPDGKLTVVISDSRGALVRDFVFDRRPRDEEWILGQLDELARRSAAFGLVDDRGARREGIEEAQRQIYAMGLAIGERLLDGSREIGDRIVDLPGDHLLLRIQPELSGIPWELMVPRRGGQFLWQLFNVSRQLRGTVGPRIRPTVRGGPLRMLLLANLEAGRNGRDLPAAEQEAVDLMGLAARHPEGLRVVRKSPTTVADLRTLMDEGFDVVHFASHASHGRDGRVGWVLPNGETVMPGDAGGSSPPAPIFVFSNSCSSGPTTELAESRVRDVAASFMTWGVPAYLGTLWELHDGGSAAFAVAFYRALLSGVTLAGAVSRARESLMGAHPITWANYVLYGDPALTLAPHTGRPRE